MPKGIFEVFTPPFRYDSETDFLVDRDGHRVLEVRAWAALTRPDGLNLSEQEALASTYQIGEELVEIINQRAEALQLARAS